MIKKYFFVIIGNNSYLEEISQFYKMIMIKLLMIFSENLYYSIMNEYDLITCL